MNKSILPDFQYTPPPPNTVPVNPALLRRGDEIVIFGSVGIVEFKGYTINKANFVKGKLSDGKFFYQEYDNSTRLLKIVHE